MRTLFLILCCLLLIASLACSRPKSSPIIFVSDRDGNTDLYAFDFDVGEETNLTSTPVNEFGPVLSPNRTLVAFQAGNDKDNSIEILDLSDETRTQVTQRIGNHTHHHWSPSGERIVYLLELPDENSLFVANTDGSNPLKLTAISGNGIGDWSGTSDAVLFVVGEGDEQGIYLRNPDGVNERRLTATPDYSPVWSPDATKIAYLSTRNNNPEIYVMNVEDGKQERLTTTDADEYDISWSPNGEHILFVSERDGNAEIYTMKSDGDDQQRLTHNNVKDIQPVWSPNGSQIAFVSYLDGDAEIVVMNANGDNQQRLTNNTAEDTDPSW